MALTVPSVALLFDDREKEISLVFTAFALFNSLLGMGITLLGFRYLVK